MAVAIAGWLQLGNFADVVLLMLSCCRGLYNTALVARLVLTWFPEPPAFLVGPLSWVPLKHSQQWRSLQGSASCSSQQKSTTQIHWPAAVIISVVAHGPVHCALCTFTLMAQEVFPDSCAELD